MLWNFHFCLVQKINDVTETVLVLKTAYKDNATGKTQVYGCFARFKNGDISIDDKPHSGCLSTAWIDENVDKNRDLVLQTVDKQLIDQLRLDLRAQFIKC